MKCIDKYKLQMRSLNSTTFVTLDDLISKEMYTVSCLLPSTGYVFRVIPHFKEYGWDMEDSAAISSPYYTEGISLYIRI